MNKRQTIPGGFKYEQIPCRSGIPNNQRGDWRPVVGRFGVFPIGMLTGHLRQSIMPPDHVAMHIGDRKGGASVEIAKQFPLPEPLEECGGQSTFRGHRSAEVFTGSIQNSLPIINYHGLPPIGLRTPAMVRNFRIASPREISNFISR